MGPETGQDSDAHRDSTEKDMENEAKNGHEAQRGGYRPLVLTLTGFNGIKSGLGRETITLDVDALAGDAALVAIAGANGRGKTTIMENCHPLC